MFVFDLKNKIIHLSYYFIKNWKLYQKDHTVIASYYMLQTLFFINFMMYRHLYYALSLAKLDEKKIILDLGCSDGPFLPTLNKYGNDICDLNHIIFYGKKGIGKYSQALNFINRFLLKLNRLI